MSDDTVGYITLRLTTNMCNADLVHVPMTELVGLEEAETIIGKIFDGYETFHFKNALTGVFTCLRVKMYPMVQVLGVYALKK